MKVKRSVIIACSIAVYIYIALASNIAVRVYRDTASRADAILILGAKSYKGDKPNPCLVARVAHGVNLYNKQLAPHILVSGGNDSEDGRNEAETMKKLAMDMGVPAEAILTESKSTSTYENFVNSKKLLDARIQFPSVIIVTEPFHMPRAAMVAHMVRLPAFVSPAVESPCWTRWKFASRYFLKEPFAILGYFFQGKLTPALLRPDPYRK